MRQLDNLWDFLTIIHDYAGSVQGGSRSILEGMYCSQCGGDRRMAVRSYIPGGHPMPSTQSPMALLERLRESYVPTMLTYTCTQCDAAYTALLYPNESKERVGLAVFPASKGTFSTPNTPEAVDYFLDQVYRCLSVGALPAALAMYRPAVDQIMISQGYHLRMLGQKIGQLENDIVAGKAPAWAVGLNPEFVRVLKDLGNAVLHVDDGDVASLKSMDAKLLAEVKVTVQELLEVIYEVEARKQTRLATLRSAHDELKASDA